MTDALPRISSFKEKLGLLLPDVLALILVLLFIRGYEIIMSYLGHVLPDGAAAWFARGLVVDLTFACLITLSILLISSFFGFIHLKFGQFVFRFLGISLMVSYTGVTQYFIYTLLPAGSDIFGYSAAELSDTISTSINFSLGGYLSFHFIHWGLFWTGLVFPEARYRQIIFTTDSGNSYYLCSTFCSHQSVCIKLSPRS